MMRYLILAALLMLSTACAAAQKPAAPPAASIPDSILGDWYGESKCVIKDSPCHDEVVIYHMTRSKDDPSKVHWAADKIVNGKPEAMGELDFVYDAAKSTLTSQFKVPRTGGTATWLFTIDGDKMHGTLSDDPGNQLFRTVEVSRKKPDGR